MNNSVSSAAPRGAPLAVMPARPPGRLDWRARRAGRTMAFVDRGFLLRDGCSVLNVPHGQYRTDAHLLVEWLRSCAAATGGAGADCSRVYWYDGAFEPSDPRHESQQRFLRAIAAEELIQPRLGQISETTPAWQRSVRRALEELGVDQGRFEEHCPLRPVLRQKGVDTLIAIDLVRLSERGALDRALVLAGDGDIAEAVRIARDAGVLITIVAPSRFSVSGRLRELADNVIAIPQEDLARIVHPRPPAPQHTGTDAGRRTGSGHATVRALPRPRATAAPAPHAAGAAPAPLVFEERAVIATDASGAAFVPFVEADRVGYIVRRPGAERKIYLNPSRYDGAAEPTVVLCIGEHGDPSLDEPCEFYRPFADREQSA
jgi:uncharacterized LabA/DUF88 family protein